MLKSYLRLLTAAFLGVLALPIIVVACFQANRWQEFGQLSSHWWPHASALVRLSLVSGYAIGAFVVFFLLLKVLRSTQAFLDTASRRQAEYLDELPASWTKGAIALSAAASLFLELAIIRWQSSVFPMFALYKNYSLLICFAGLGLGYSLSKRESIPLFLSIPLQAFQVLFLLAMRYGPGRDAFWLTPFREQLNMGVGISQSIPVLIAIYSLLAVVFLLTVLAFVPVGQLCGRLMAKRSSLDAYGLNLLGSILGVALVSGVSFFWTPPSIWFSIAFVMLLAFQTFDSRVLCIGILTSFVALAALDWPLTPGWEKIYSPYQLLELVPGDRGLMSIRAAGHYYQRVHDLSISSQDPTVNRYLLKIAQYYELPYRIYGRSAGRVAVVGAGTGNDVEAALRCSAEHVDAIEIDPAILRLGRLYQPEHPYDNPRVTAVVNDARTFMRATTNQYDMIVYGLLDSHTLLSQASSVRLDSFVYTVQGIREARARLKEGGLISLSFCMMSKEIGRKIFLMMQEAFDGRPPVCIRAGYDNSVVFLQSAGRAPPVDPALLQDEGFDDISALYANPEIKADVSTDDWPFLYMPRRAYPTSYLTLMGLILLVSLLTIGNFFGQKPVLSHVAFLFLGAGFMLVETKAITELGLVFGNTWHVIGLVIAGTLVMAFLANAFVRRFRVSRPFIPFVLLVTSLLLGYVISQRVGFGSSVIGKLAAIVVLTGPMFFSGIVFSSLLARVGDIAGAMAINLLGTMIGGVLEYNSMYFGFGFLYLLAAFLYLLAFGSCYVGRRTAVS